MASQTTVAGAQYADIPAMVKIHWESMESDVLTTFLSGTNREAAIKKHTESLTNTLGKRFTNPTNRCHVHKAVDSESGEIVGWSLVRWEDGKIVVPPEPETKEFRPHYVREIMKAWLATCRGKEHVVLGGLYVSPAHQGKRIGTMLIENIYNLYELEKEPVIVQTRAKTEQFYAKLGWKTIGSANMDLNKWAGEGQGYGLHRSPQMLRDPSGKWQS